MYFGHRRNSFSNETTRGPFRTSGSGLPSSNETTTCCLTIGDSHFWMMILASLRCTQITSTVFTSPLDSVIHHFASAWSFSFDSIKPDCIINVGHTSDLPWGTSRGANIWSAFFMHEGACISADPVQSRDILAPFIAANLVSIMLTRPACALS